MATDSTPLDDPGSVLAAVAARRAEETRAGNDVLALTASYCAMNSADSIADAAVHDSPLFGDRGIPLAGEGAPLVSEFAVAELAAVLGMSTDSGRRLVGDVLELRYRLPGIWARVLDYSLPAYKARMIAQRTRELPAEAAAWVDTQVAPVADRFGWGRVGRLVEQALATYDPEAAAQKAAEEAGRFHVDVDTHPMLTDVSGPAAGFARIEATLDLADAADFETAVSAIAHGLLDAEATAGLSLPERRAKAVGILARHYTGTQTEGDASGTARVLHLYAHIGPAELAGTGLVAVDNYQALIPVEQLAEWATTPGTVVKPVRVIDLNTDLNTDTGAARDRYTPSPTQREQVALIGRTCVFPHCNRPAWSCDTDHITAYDPDGPPGQTTTTNLAPLCRRHHRLKTHGGWTYQQIHPGIYLWRSPHGYTFLRHQRGGTTQITGSDQPDAG